MPGTRHIVLGIDPGIANLGWAVVELTGHKRALVDCGTLHTAPGTEDDVRVHYLGHQVRDLMFRFQPSVVGVEAHVWMGKDRSANPEAFRVSRLSGLMEGLALGNHFHHPVVVRLTRNQALHSVGANSEDAGNATIARLLQLPARTSQHARDAAIIAWAASQRVRKS